MNVVFDFIKSHYELLISIVVYFVGFITLLCKKKVKITDSAFTEVVSSIPSLISQAEVLYPGSKTGEDKLQFVLTVAIDLLAEKTCASVAECSKIYSDKIKAIVEAVLATPKKK